MEVIFHQGGRPKAGVELIKAIFLSSKTLLAPRSGISNFLDSNSGRKIFFKTLVCADYPVLVGAFA